MNSNYLVNKVNVNGVGLYYECIGQYKQGPTVVFESGYGWALDNWEPIRAGVSEFAKVFLYDRASVGKSDKGNQSKHSLQIVENLRALLEKANIKPPFLLVGHSFGGVNVRLYASTYPDNVAGVILLDSCHEDQNSIMVPLFSKEMRRDYLQQFSVEGSLKEFEESLEQVRDRSIGSIPLTVLTASSYIPIYGCLDEISKRTCNAIFGK
ncbi:alpha/beta hydrolase [Psychrobacillus sp.]|uniref:alpha/beta fold hydrolase n=1 Tax=Psychrobacillus sp. TaxID=1871623 RepID=UPI0028BDA0F0|nr:alpha/beta hydrolase [Psychrobacillus sp.]